MKKIILDGLQKELKEAENELTRAIRSSDQYCKIQRYSSTEWRPAREAADFAIKGITKARDRYDEVVATIKDVEERL